MRISDNLPFHKFCCFFLGLFLTGQLLVSAPILTSEIEPFPTAHQRPSVALVLGGGGAKGFAHVPILAAMEQMDIPIDMIIGTSIGAVIGGIYAAGYSPNQILDEISNVNWPKIFTDSFHSPYENLLEDHSKYALPLTATFNYNFNLRLGEGISSGQQIYQLLRKLTLKYPSDISFDQLAIPFRAIATDAVTGEAFVLQDGDVAEAIRASMSIPGVFDTFPIDGQKFMDGGLRYNLAINVAKEMGFDIIIAVDLSQQDDASAGNEANPMVAILNSINISQKFITEALYEDATLVIKPDIQEFGILDFLKAPEIYQSGEDTARESFLALEKVRRLIYPADYDAAGRRISFYKPLRLTGAYDALEPLTIAHVSLKGALPSDQDYLLKRLKEVQGDKLNQDTLEEVFHILRLTGNYQLVVLRSLQGKAGTVLQVELTPSVQKNIRLSLGVDFRLTTGMASSSQFNLSPELQFRGLTGPASVISVRGTFIDDFGGKFFYFQPFTPYIYGQMESNFHQDKYARTSRNKKIPTQVQEISRWKNKISVGFKTRTNSLLRVDGFHHYLDTNELTFSQDKNLMYYMENTNMEYRHLQDIGLKLNFVLDFQEKHIFAERGFYGDFWAKIFFPLQHLHWNNFAITAGADMHHSIPLGTKFTLSFKGFAGFDVMERMKSLPGYVMIEGFNNYDRAYFPQIPSEDRYGLHKLATGLSLQFKPLPWLTIFGGDLFLRLNAAVGNVAYDFQDIIPLKPESENTIQKQPLLWNSSLGMGVRFSESFTVYLRGGIGSTSQGRITPFFALDIGSLWF